MLFKKLKPVLFNIHRFVTGPPNMKNEDNLGKVPHVYLDTDIQTEECHLVVYKALSATVCLFVEGKRT